MADIHTTHLKTKFGIGVSKNLVKRSLLFGKKIKKIFRYVPNALSFYKNTRFLCIKFERPGRHL